MAARLSPDVVLMDIGMPRMDGVEATRRIVRIHVEEAELATAHGPEYTRYASRTHRLVPGLW